MCSTVLAPLIVNMTGEQAYGAILVRLARLLNDVIFDDHFSLEANKAICMDVCFYQTSGNGLYVTSILRRQRSSVGKLRRCL